MSTLGRDSNPITNSDLYTRTDHFVSVATGHQVSNRGGGSSGAATYWTVRTAKMEEQAREKVSVTTPSWNAWMAPSALVATCADRKNHVHSIVS